MNCFNDQIKLEAFEETTTYRNDYKRFCDTKKDSLKPERIREEPPTKPPSHRHYEDHETFFPIKDDVYIPFDLLMYPKPIIQTDPRQPFVRLAPLPEDDHVKAVKTRPRIYMTPACSMDDIPDQNMRKLLCDYMYTTEWRKAEIEGASGFTPQVPDLNEIGSHDSVSLQTDLYPPLEEKFIKTGKSWDDEQRRGSSDPTKSFWIHKDPPVLCGACVNPLQNIVAKETKQEIAEAIAEDRLRLAHDIPCPSYAGHRPIISTGVSISRKKLPITHPMLSVNQANNRGYSDDRERERQKNRRISNIPI